MPVRTRSHRLLMACCWLFAVFLVLFPKGGFKIGPLPLTWGYLLLALTTPVFLAVRLLALPLRFPPRLLAAIALLLPMQAALFYALDIYGTTQPAFAFSTFVGLVALPWIFLLIYPPFLPFVDGAKLSAYFRACVLIAALWGLFLFVYFPLTGHFVEIPYLTVNAADYGLIESTKHIARGLFSKLISTYNNGNVYGVATLVLLPLYECLEPARWRRLTVKLALFLTLSRTVWFGLLVNEALPILVHLWRQTATFPVVYLAKFRRRLAAFAVTIVVICFSLLLISNAGIGFLFDPTVGGRIGQITSISSVTLLPNHPVSGFTEILYASALREFGVAGLIALLLLVASPVLLLLIAPRALHSPIRRAALKGLILYALVALSDGAFNYIPVMAFYWFVYMIYLFGWPRPHPNRIPTPADRHLAAPPSSTIAASAQPLL